MSSAKDFKEVFKKMDQFNNDDISWEELNFHGIRNRSPPMTMSQVDDIFGELGTDGEDRVFGASRDLVNQLHRSSLPVKHEDVANKELNKEVSILKVDDNAKNIENQLETPKVPLVEKKNFKDLVEDWVVVEKNNIDA
ncbi:Uncharacterized protein Rs2_32728 [Raphanus sativus]|uniref:Uncharacterized protein LOC108815132 n=1 Tax=Raphanus sativus TaxID=3726 RepID=A0A6J0K8K2_RAPSA|nr:uncharacterized protein LOC108815132 [Raphanus sativus]KAJ4882635.1 Uncharacterized protein Rs2_32728 [Raphanus sativus]